MSEIKALEKSVPPRTAPSSPVARDDPARINVCTLDSHAVVRFGLECKIRDQYDMHWVGSGTDYREMSALLREFICDVVIVEYQLEGLENDGWNLIKQFQRNFPDTRLLIYTGYMSAATTSLMYRAGAARVLSKSSSMDQLIDAVRELGFASWHARFHGDRKRPKVHALPVETHEAYVPTSHSEALEGAGLSTREMEVLRCLLQGMSVSQISHKFVRSIKTISSQKQAAFRKLSVSSNQDLFRLQKSFHIL
ncbi:MAG: response regulator transcription factor [Variovorax sp.]|jgi:two-component system capsular synthesis response regulator RcsB|nr:MAG: response regulator transcription factor [Variovorax sp.]